MKEVEQKCFAGPFENIPYKNFVQSPIGLVPKAGGKTRLIFHLSYHFGQYQSVNAYTPKTKCTVRYQDLDHAIQESLRLLEGIITGKTGTIWYGKTDVQSAFRLLPLGPWTFWLLIMKAKDPKSGKTYYFVDKCLPFGHSISCALFQEFSDALAHMAKYLIRKNLGIKAPALTNYLDDFLFAALMKQICDQMLQQFLAMCEALRVPISEDKTVYADTRMVFLGILLDGKLLILEEKWIKAVNLLQSFTCRQKAMVKEIQSLAGLLNFLNKAIVPGRVLTRRMYAKYSEIVDYHGNRILGSHLKPHHHIKLDQEFKLDCSVWLQFSLKMENNPTALCRPFIDLNRTLSANTLDFYTDAAKGVFLGMGGVFGSKWFFAKWEQNYIQQFDPSIEYLELLALCTAVFCWIEQLENKRIILFCDNQSVITMVNNTTAKCKNCMILLRMLVVKSLEWNTRIFCKWVRGAENSRADFLSCQKLTQFFNYARTHGIRIESTPTSLPKELWPASNIWVKWFTSKVIFLLRREQTTEENINFIKIFNQLFNINKWNGINHWNVAVTKI